MGYKITLPKDRSFLGIDISDAYHSIDSVSLSGGYVTITVAVYPSREAKYNTGKIQSGIISPKYLDVEDDGFSEIEPDVASETSINYSPIRNVIIPKMGAYTLKISASALFPDVMPYDIEIQKESLYPTVKRLLGHGNAEDVFEETDEEIDIQAMNNQK